MIYCLYDVAGGTLYKSSSTRHTIAFWILKGGIYNDRPGDHATSRRQSRFLLFFRQAPYRYRPGDFTPYLLVALAACDRHTDQTRFARPSHLCAVKGRGQTAARRTASSMGNPDLSNL